MSVALIWSLLFYYISLGPDCFHSDEFNLHCWYFFAKNEALTAIYVTSCNILILMVQILGLDMII